ncbi:hypothetical protein [Hymenobacter sp. YC55]|uniref:hypothetical protein n=1 Tax=Hymenobacter sp. YC55 TaxID=3034019 RepID=UPI0023FA017A|nr:hypothetical protein [Hymenobacter sp. YC55]MDF7815740.1 hypothetical protein [Hymenobacter sp. YC55]
MRCAVRAHAHRGQHLGLLVARQVPAPRELVAHQAREAAPDRGPADHTRSPK